MIRNNTALRLSDLPDWDIVLNYPGSPFSGPSDDDIVVVCHGSGLPVTDVIGWDLLLAARAKPADVWILTKTQDPVKISGAASRLKDYKALSLRGTRYCSSDVLQSVRDAFAARVVGAARRSESGEHALFDEIGRDALQKKASDIHISLLEDRASISYRIKGELRQIKEISIERGRALVSSIYNTLAEKGSTKEGFNERSYQDAVIERAYSEGLVRFRYSGLPIAPVGSDITLRIIPIGVTSKPRTLQELGYSQDQCDLLERIFSRSSGLVLIAGTTGSGKSTTLSTVLSSLARAHPEKKIRTIEEPVEYKIPGAFQTPVLRQDSQAGKEIANPFGVALRQLMRSDPDIIMVGEIRDVETANLAIQGVRSGHMLVSTIHADGAPICFDRLMGMGVSRADMASIGLIAGLVYQRLIPVLCPHCKVSYADWILSSAYNSRLNRRIKAVVADEHLGSLSFRRHGGCKLCDHDGVADREVVAEILRPTPEMTHAIVSYNSNDLWSIWRSTISSSDPNNMTGRTAFEHALHKMRLGRVDPADVESAFRYLDEAVFGENQKC